MNSTLHDDLGPVKLLHYGVEGTVDSNDNETADNNRPIFCSSSEEILTDSVLSTLQRDVLFQSHPDFTE